MNKSSKQVVNFTMDKNNQHLTAVMPCENIYVRVRVIVTNIMLLIFVCRFLFIRVACNQINYNGYNNRSRATAVQT